jgi:hypothetical protein
MLLRRLLLLRAGVAQCFVLGLAGIEPMPSGARFGRGTAFDLLLLPPRSVRAVSLCVDFCTHTEMMGQTHQFCGFGVLGSGRSRGRGHCDSQVYFSHFM